MPDPTDPTFLPRININRSDFSNGLLWLDRAGQQEDEPGGWSGRSCVSSSPVSCDSRDVKSPYSVCDKTSPVSLPSPTTSYYECCVKVSASKLLDHWLNDHQDGPAVEHCQSERAKPSCGQPTENRLHVLLSRQFRQPDIGSAVRSAVLRPGQEIDTADYHGDTPLTLIRHLLEEAKFSEARDVAEVLLEAGADPNHRNMCGWSALSYSLVHQDNSLAVTRSLLHHGSTIAPRQSGASLPDITYLPLRVLMRSILRSQTCHNSRETLHILGQVLATQENPRRMKEVVLAAILAEASRLTSNGPEIAREIKNILSPYWSQPKPLLQLSLQATRRRLASLKRLNDGKLKDVVIAPRIQSYLSYKSTLPILYSQTQNNRKQKTDEGDRLSEKIRLRLTTQPALL